MLFGHHFAAITGAGPLIGPVLAAQFGYAPGLIWLVAGVCLAGAVHDFIILWASTRRGGRSLAEIARAEIGPVAGTTAAVAILFIVVIALAGLGLAVVNALAGERLGHVHDRRRRSRSRSSWASTCTGSGKGTIAEATVIGVAGLLLAVILGQAGRGVVDRRTGSTLSREQLIVAMAAYGFVASVLPVWMLLCPRDYLSSFMKIGTIALLVVGVIDRQPRAADAGVHPVHRRRRPDHPGPALPVRLHHHRLRRDLRLPRADRVGHDAEDDRPRVRHPRRSATARC